MISCSKTSPNLNLIYLKEKQCYVFFVLGSINMSSVMFPFRWPSALWVRGGYCRRRVSAAPAVWYLGQSTSLICFLDNKWKQCGSRSRWLHRDQWWLYKQAIRQSGKKLAWRQVSVFSGFSPQWKTNQGLLCHSNRSVHTITFSKATYLC